MIASENEHPEIVQLPSLGGGLTFDQITVHMGKKHTTAQDTASKISLLVRLWVQKMSTKKTQKKCPQKEKAFRNSIIKTGERNESVSYVGRREDSGDSLFKAAFTAPPLKHIP